MEPKIIEANHESFVINFKNGGSSDYNMRWSGMAIQIQEYSDGTWLYQSNKSSDSTENIAEARVWFEWSFCWRGVWEGRIYFKGDEYWCQEMETIPEIWKQIEAIVKERIMLDNPDYGSFD